MDIQFHGANCITIATKQVRFVFDDTLEALGAKSVVREGDIALFTSAHATLPKAKMTIDLPGEYEVSGALIHGMQSRSHLDTDAERNAVMYKIVIGDVKVLVVGHAFPKLSEAKLEDIGLVDIMLIPVGGNGYTIDPVGAMQIVKDVEPKIVVPTHYADDSLQYEVPQQTLDDALKTMGVEVSETVKKLQFKVSEAADSTRFVVIEKS